jgi:uncharacterized protein YdhG (YjbR/CyaY superfamily)
MRTKKTNIDIDQYISQFPEEIQILLEEMRSCIKKAAPDAEELISYRMPAYKQNGMLVYFAGYKNHIGFYPGALGIEAFKAEIADFKNAKGSVQFPIDKGLPLKLINKIVKFRVKQNVEKIKLKDRKLKVRRHSGEALLNVSCYEANNCNKSEDIMKIKN